MLTLVPSQGTNYIRLSNKQGIICSAVQMTSLRTRTGPASRCLVRNLLGQIPSQDNCSNLSLALAMFNSLIGKTPSPCSSEALTHLKMQLM
jgi:hypothetical protein